MLVRQHDHRDRREIARSRLDAIMRLRGETDAREGARDGRKVKCPRPLTPRAGQGRDQIGRVKLDARDLEGPLLGVLRPRPAEEVEL